MEHIQLFENYKKKYTKEEIIGKKKKVTILKGWNIQKNARSVAVLGKVPSKTGGWSDWFVKVDLNTSGVKRSEISVDDFEPRDYDKIIIDGRVLIKNVSY